MSSSEILYLSFNQDHNCFTCGTQNGFTIFTVDPVRVRYSQDFNAGIGICECLYDTNIVALVGGGDHPMFPRNKVVVWDDKEKKKVWAFEYYSDVLGVKFNREQLIIINETDIEIFKFTNLTRIKKVKTMKNPNAIGALSVNKNIPILISPAKVTCPVGSVNIVNFVTNHEQMVQCHDGDLQLVALNQDATKFATCSTKGTLVRVWDVETGNKIKELRRGSDQCEIYNINFSRDSKYLVVTSAKGTIHVFSLSDTAGNQTSSLGVFGSVVGYLGSEWSAFKVAYDSDTPHIATLLSNEDGQLDRLLVVDYTGRFSFHKIDVKNQDVFQLEEGRLSEVPPFRYGSPSVTPRETVSSNGESCDHDKLKGDA